MRSSRHIVLVTGGTGIIGGKVIPALVARGAEIRALIRSPDHTSAERRLIERLDKNRPSMRDDAGRVLSCPGDTTRPGLGLSAGDAEGVTTIVHASGSTAFKDDEPGWQGNIDSARNLVAFARSLPGRPRVIYVSTASVCIPEVGGVVHEDMAPHGFDNGYITSKRAAERIFREATDLNLVIVRPSIVIGHGIDDKRMARSILWVIPAMAMLGDVPLDPDSRIDLSEVGFVSEAIAALALKPGLRHDCYHISAGTDRSATCGGILRALNEHGLFVGQVRMLGPGPWPKRRRLSGLQRQVRESMDFYIPFLNADVVYDHTRLREELGAQFPSCPPVTDYVHRVMGLISDQDALRESQLP